MIEWRQVGREEECEGVYLKRIKRRPVAYQFTNDHLVEGMLRKAEKGRIAWDVLLPGGGLHTFRYKRDACKFIARLIPLEEESETDSGAVL